jgi:hypothetical protein
MGQRFQGLGQYMMVVGAVWSDFVTIGSERASSVRS